LKETFLLDISQINGGQNVRKNVCSNFGQEMIGCGFRFKHHCPPMQNLACHGIEATKKVAILHETEKTSDDVKRCTSTHPSSGHACSASIEQRHHCIFRTSTKLVHFKRQRMIKFMRNNLKNLGTTKKRKS
jgi:hypothetical protein